MIPFWFIAQVQKLKKQRKKKKKKKNLLKAFELKILLHKFQNDESLGLYQYWYILALF